MGQSSRRRKGKGGSRSSTPTPTEKDSKNETLHAKNASTKGSSDAKTSKSGSNASSNNSSNNHNNNNNDDHNNGSASVVLDDDALLVLTSAKKTGIYECDYCHSDISQLPRIRCAVCTDFDLCLNCFITSNHGAVTARNKAANQTRNELQKDGIESSSIEISSAAAHHEDHHCYRVCDSTRYPIFPPGRIVVPKGFGGTSSTSSSTAASTAASTAQSTDSAASAATRKESSADEPMVDRDAKTKATTKAPPSIPSPPAPPPAPRCVEVTVTDEAKTIWTAEEDLRLIDAIGSLGLGNWVDIADAVSGNGSVGKTAKRCMERYLDDFLGRYGHILPQWTVVDDNYNHEHEVNKHKKHCGAEESENNAKQTAGDVETNKNSSSSSKKSKNKNNNGNNNNNASSDATSTTAEGAGALSVAQGKTDQDQKKAPETGREQSRSEPASPLPNTNTNANTSSAPKIVAEDEDRVRTSKRRSASNTLSSSSFSSSSSRKKLRVVPTESLPGYRKLWSDPYLPAVPGAVLGKEVARDQSCKAELAFVKATLSAPTKADADRIRKTWIDTKLGRVGSPTVLPPRPHDAVHLLGSELAGFMPRRGDFDVEWENDAETALADMEFIRGDRPEDRELKLKVLQIYCEKLDEREKRKKFVLHRHLYDYRTYVQNDLRLPVDERDLVHRMRLFERFHTPDEHKRFISDILRAKKLRKEIAKLQMYRRIGIRTLAEAELYELDKDRRQFHKKLELDAKAKAAAAAAAALAGAKGKGGAASPSAVAASLKARTLSASSASSSLSQFRATDSLWKQYRTNDRKNRRSTSRSGTSTEGTIGSNSHISSSNNNIKSSSDNARARGKDGKNSKGETKEEERLRRHDEQTRDTNDPKDGKGMPTTAAESRTAGETVGTATDTPAAAASEDGDDPMEVDVPEKTKKKKKAFRLSAAPCFDLLSRKERALCEKLQIYPLQYLEIKKALIHESLANGLLNKESSQSSRRTIVKIDVERRGNIVDFLVRAGWIDRKLGDAALRVVTPQPLSQN